METTIQYKCRRCGKVDSTTQGKEQTCRMAVIEAISHGIGNCCGVRCFLITTHTCADGGLGVTDLIGAGPEMQPQSPEEEIFYSGRPCTEAETARLRKWLADHPAQRGGERSIQRTAVFSFILLLRVACANVPNKPVATHLPSHTWPTGTARLFLGGFLGFCCFFLFYSLLNSL